MKKQSWMDKAHHEGGVTTATKPLLAKNRLDFINMYKTFIILFVLSHG